VRYLIVSDIHANREALDAVVENAAGKYDVIFCCGDVVGYGADPNYGVEWVRANVKTTVRGNHDRACAGLEDLEWFNPAARHSALWTRAELTDENLEWLRTLPQGPAALDGFDLIHGSPLDEDEYLISVHDALQTAPYVGAALSFFGHTHLQGGFLLHRNGVKRLRRPDAGESQLTIELEPDVAYLINPGSVGQPRDGDPRAAYAVYSQAQGIIEFHRVEYDVAAAQKKIREAGLPDLLAERLAFGT
jgi:diadenosine tetraphosphatase ApaH/serine/threonine PP2A family protein phosphatase